MNDGITKKLWQSFEDEFQSEGTYLCETSPVVTTDEVDMTFFPATSTASHTLSAQQHIKIRQIPWHNIIRTMLASHWLQLCRIPNMK